MKFGIFFRMKFRNCTKSGKANAEIFSELSWNNFRIWQYLPNFFPRLIRSILTIPNFFPRSFGVFRIFFWGQFRVFGQFRIIFRGHSDNFKFFSEVNSDNSEFFPGIPNWFPNYMRKIYGNSSKSSVFPRKYFFSHSKSQNTLNSIFRPNIRNLLLRVMVLPCSKGDNETSPAYLSIKYILYTMYIAHLAYTEWLMIQRDKYIE
jgi:hypothetical protein